MSKIQMPGIFISAGLPDAGFMDALNKATYEWEMKAARGECEWICSDCCGYFPDGMPYACQHGIDSCTRIIERVKRDAAMEKQK